MKSREEVGRLARDVFVGHSNYEAVAGTLCAEEFEMFIHMFNSLSIIGRAATDLQELQKATRV